MLSAMITLYLRHMLRARFAACCLRLLPCLFRCFILIIFAGFTTNISPRHAATSYCHGRCRLRFFIDALRLISPSIDAAADDTLMPPSMLLPLPFAFLRAALRADFFDAAILCAFDFIDAASMLSFIAWLFRFLRHFSLPPIFRHFRWLPLPHFRSIFLFIYLLFHLMIIAFLSFSCHFIDIDAAAFAAAIFLAAIW